MNKKGQLLKQAQELIKKAREIEAVERQKVGKLVLSMYEKDEIKDSELKASIVAIVGNLGTSSQDKIAIVDESDNEFNSKL